MMEKHSPRFCRSLFNTVTTLQPTFARLVGTLSTNKLLELTRLPRASTGDLRTGRRAEKPPVRSNEDFHYSLV
jgi:hypothetical protein